MIMGTVGVIKPKLTHEWGLSEENGLLQALDKVLHLKRGKNRNVELRLAS